VFGLGAGCIEDGNVTSQTLCYLFNFLSLAILIRVVLSWVTVLSSVRIDPMNPVVQALHAVTDPLIDPIRNLMPRGLMIDFSPFIVLILLNVLSLPLQEMLRDNSF
jgi:YggT family protein